MQSSSHIGNGTPPKSDSVTKQEPERRAIPNNKTFSATETEPDKDVASPLVNEKEDKPSSGRNFYSTGIVEEAQAKEISEVKVQELEDTTSEKISIRCVSPLDKPERASSEINPTPSGTDYVSWREEWSSLRDDVLEVNRSIINDGMSDIIASGGQTTPVDSNGRRNKKSAAPVELGFALFKGNMRAVDAERMRSNNEKIWTRN